MSGAPLRPDRRPRVGPAVGVCIALAVCGCRLPPPASSEPRTARVDLARIEALHPAAPELKALRTPFETAPPRTAPATGSGPQAPDLPGATAVPPEPEPERRVDAARAEAEIRADYRRRREAVPPPDPAPDPPRAGSPTAPEPARAATSPEFTTGLEAGMARLQRQLDELREGPRDRLIYTPVQLRRRRELFEVTRAELERLRGEHLSRIREALTPSGAPQARERAARRPSAPPRPAGPAPGVVAAETRALAAIPRGPTLPLPAPPAPAPPPLDPHEAERARFAAGVNGPGGGPAAGSAQRLLDARRRRAEALELAIREDARAVATAVAAEAGYRLVWDRPAPDVTPTLLPRIRERLSTAEKGTAR